MGMRPPTSGVLSVPAAGPASRPALVSTGFNAGAPEFGRIVAGEGAWFRLADGSRVLDASNTGCSVGHGHPRMVEAVRAAAASPVVNEGWYWEEREAAARDLLDIAFAGEDWVGGVRFCLSGSEANDLALSLAQAVTGRQPLATRERAYHGLVGLARDMTVQPQWHGGLSHVDGTVDSVPRTAPVRVLPAPVGALVRRDGVPASVPDAGDLRQGLDGAAAVVIDYTQGGTYYSAGYQDAVARAAAGAGALWVADEVVSGFGRFGRWFGFQGAASRPDIVVLGKPLAGGAAPAGAVVLSRRLQALLDDATWRTYSTFRAHPLMVAATRAHLHVLRDEGLVERAATLEPLLRDGLLELADRHACVNRVDGRGLHWTVELVGQQWRTWTAATADVPVASRVASRALQAGALIGTSGESHSLFLAPPLVVSEEDLTHLVHALDAGLGVADERIG
jgi:4-aminobutyrate aminotransferase-like enzyme